MRRRAHYVKASCHTQNRKCITLLQSRQRRTATGNVKVNLVKFGLVVFEISVQTDRQTDRLAYHNESQLKSNNEPYDNHSAD